MKGVLYIDGVDVYTEYGISVSDVAYDDLVCFPSLKDIPFNDWHEKNGIDPDLSAPVINARDITIPFYVSDVHSGYSAFIEALTDDSYHTFNFATIGLTKSLRLKSCGELKSVSGLGSFSLVFSDDDPRNTLTDVTPSSVIAKYGDFLLDGVDFAEYGIRFLRGTMDSITQMPDIKENLKRDISVVHGLQYDGQNVTYKSRTASLRCLMRARSSDEFWNNWNALLYDLVKSGSRTLMVKELGKEIPCYYKGCTAICFFPDRGQFWFEFTLDLEFYKGVI